MGSPAGGSPRWLVECPVGKSQRAHGAQRADHGRHPEAPLTHEAASAAVPERVMVNGP